MSKTELPLLVPDWPAPPNVKAISTTRQGGMSMAPYDSLNLGDHVGDDIHAVIANRVRLRQQLPAEPHWLTQVHGIEVVNAAEAAPHTEADAAFSRTHQCVCAVMTADCLPVLLCDRSGTVVAAAHAGWRGLCNGVIENTLNAMQAPTSEILAWLGPAISPTAFEVGEDVRNAFIAHDPIAAAAFVPGEAGEKWLANLYLLARQRLNACGVTAIHGGEHCTLTEQGTFFSYRREGKTGRMASLIWLE